MFSVLVAISMTGMRGYNYRAPIIGITLVVAQPFPSKRDSIQGLGRVGRQGDECTRVMIEECKQLYSQNNKSETTQKLMAFVSANRSSKPVNV